MHNLLPQLAMGVRLPSSVPSWNLKRLVGSSIVRRLVSQQSYKFRQRASRSTDVFTKRALFFTINQKQWCRLGVFLRRERCRGRKSNFCNAAWSRTRPASWCSSSSLVRAACVVANRFWSWRTCTEGDGSACEETLAPRGKKLAASPHVWCSIVGVANPKVPERPTVHLGPIRDLEIQH